MRADYVWGQLYETAVLETEDKNLSNRLQAVKATIDSRLHEMQVDHGGTPEELQAISDALHGINLLQQSWKHALTQRVRATLESH